MEKTKPEVVWGMLLCAYDGAGKPCFEEYIEFRSAEDALRWLPLLFHADQHVGDTPFLVYPYNQERQHGAYDRLFGMAVF